MKIKNLFKRSHNPRCSGAVRLLFILAVAVVLWSQNAVGQQPAIPKLTLAQVEELVSHGVPDSSTQTQIQRRGLAFAPTPAIVESLRAKGAGPLTLAAIEALIPKPKAPTSAVTSRAAPTAKYGGAKPITPATPPTQIQLGMGTVEAHTEPGSQLFLDSKEVGNAGADGLLMLQNVVEGDHELIARSEGYQGADSKFSLSKNEAKQLSLPMEWLGGFLSVSAQPADASIHITGQRSFDGSATDVKAQSGSYTATVSLDGYVTQTRNFQIAVGEHHVEQFQLAIDLAAALAKANAGDQSSLYILEQAVARGENVVVNIKTLVGYYTGPGLIDGTITVSKTAVSYHRTVGGDRDQPDFSVSPDKILLLAKTSLPTPPGTQPTPDINLRVAIMNKKGKEDKYTFQICNHSAALLAAGSNGYATMLRVACDGCDNSLDVLFALLRTVYGMK